MLKNECEWEHDNSKPMGCRKSSAKMDVYSNTSLPQETRETSNKGSTLIAKAARKRTKNPTKLVEGKKL